MRCRGSCVLCSWSEAYSRVTMSKFTQGGEKLDDAIKWAENELEATLRA